MTENLQQLHQRSLEEFDRRVKGIGSDQWGNATPCSEWSVRDLVNHIVNEDRWTVPLMQGATIEEVGDRFDGDLLGDDPKGSWELAKKEASNAVQAEGALDRIVNVSWGQIPATEYVGQLFTDHVIHSWDLARGIGADDTLDAELVEVCYSMVKPREKQIAGSGVFGTPIAVSEAADTQTKLLAIMGRER
ncbi:MAG: TIGR03086 family metal-binding protein [Actinomycetota bacterium]